MADSSVTLPGSGTVVDTRTEATNTNHRQVIVLGDPSVNAGVAPVDSVGGLTVSMAASSPGIIATGTQAAPSASYLSTVAAGDLAHDAADTGNPVKFGGVARSSEPAAVSASGDRINAIFDMVGKQIVLPYANPENFVSGVIATAMTGTTSTAVTGMGAPGGSLRNYITQLTVSNSHATVGTDVELQDGSGGATFYIVPAAAVYGGAAITFPTPLKQPTVNTALYAKDSVTGASVRLSASGYKGL